MVEGKTESISKDAEPVEAPKVVRLDVLFSFGLVTVQIDPEIDSYMNAVEQVVLKAIADDANLASKITYDPSFKPFVKDTYWDCKLALRITPNLSHASIVAS